MNLLVGRAYHLSGFEKLKWGNTHPTYGQPNEVAARYLGSLRGSRLWHGFEVRMAMKDVGVLFLPDADLRKLTIREL